MKVICAGLQKTGTKSMAEALRFLGYNVHDVFDQYFLDNELWLKVRNNTATSDDYRRVLGKVDAVTDYPACGLWEEIFRAFPESKVILMERSSEDEWYESLLKQCKKTNSKRVLERAGIPHDIVTLFMGPTNMKYKQHSKAFHPGCVACNDLEDVPVGALARVKYRQHNTYVKATCPKEQLLVFNVRQGWGPLCKFLERPVPDVPFPFLNKDASIVDKVAKCEHADYGFMKAVYRESSLRIGLTIVLILLFLCLLVHYLYLNLRLLVP